MDPPRSHDPVAHGETGDALDGPKRRVYLSNQRVIIASDDVENASLPSMLGPPCNAFRNASENACGKTAGPNAPIQSK
jgi:hypothetical protein